MVILSKANSHSPQDALPPLDEAPGDYGVLNLLGISMHSNLWEVLIECNLAKEKGKQGNILDKKGILQFIIYNVAAARSLLGVSKCLLCTSCNW